MLLKWPI